MLSRIIFFSIAILSMLVGCASSEWIEIKDLNQYSAMRVELSKPSLTFKEVTIVRLRNNGKRVEFTSIAPAVIGEHKNGPPAAKTLFTFSPDRARVILFSQDVKNWKAFRKEISVSQLVPGFTFHFPVVQEAGDLAVQAYEVEQVFVK